MSKEKLWIDNINSFFGNWTIIPTSKMTREEKLNSVTRLILVVSISLLLFGKKDASLYILTIGLIIVIVIYSQETAKQQPEHPNTVEGFDYIDDLGIRLYGRNAREIERGSVDRNLGTPSSKGRTIDGVVLPGGRAPIFTCDVTYYPTFMSGDSPNVIGKNASLTGPQNPKTLMPPPIAPPLADLDTWKANEWTTHSHINSRTVQYEDEAGPFRTFRNHSERVIPVNCLSSYEDDQANNPCFKRYLSRIGMSSELGIMESFEDFGSGGEPQVPESGGALVKDLDEPYYSPFSKTSSDIIEPFISELQPGIYTSNIDQPILANDGLLPDIPQSQTTLFTPIINGKPRDKMQIYVEDKEADVIPSFNNSGYRSLDRAYELPQRYVRERLPKRYGEWRARRSTIPGIPFNTRVGYGTDTEGVGGPCTLGGTGWVSGVENVRDLSGAEEMSEYYNKNKLDMFDVDENAPLYAINPSAVQTHIEVTNRFRSNMQESLMRKRNAEAWQRKQYPLDTNHRRMLGGGGF
jgi:Family of unknown function (DUF5762)